MYACAKLRLNLKETLFFFADWGSLILYWTTHSGGGLIERIYHLSELMIKMKVYVYTYVHKEYLWNTNKVVEDGISRKHLNSGPAKQEEGGVRDLIVR